MPPRRQLSAFAICRHAFAARYFLLRYCRRRLFIAPLPLLLFLRGIATPFCGFGAAQLEIRAAMPLCHYYHNVASPCADR